MSRYIEYDAIDYRNDKLHDKSEEFLNGVIYMAQRIEEAPSIDIPQWIPCSERLPSEYGRYLVTIKTDGDLGEFELHETETKIIRFSTKGWLLPRHLPQWIDDALTQKVLAWMPLPEPYREREDER